MRSNQPRHRSDQDDGERSLPATSQAARRRSGASGQPREADRRPEGCDLVGDEKQDGAGDVVQTRRLDEEGTPSGDAGRDQPSRAPGLEVAHQRGDPECRKEEVVPGWHARESSSAGSTSPPPRSPARQQTARTERDAIQNTAGTQASRNANTVQRNAIDLTPPSLNASACR